MGMRAWDCMTHRIRAVCAAPISLAKQTGIRQRSLRKHCRLGRATELVFITALGTAVMIGGGAAAQSVTYTDGQNRTDTVDTAGGVDLTVNGADAATQSGVVSGAGDVNKRGSGTLTLSGANTYTGVTKIHAGTLDVTGSIASSRINLFRGELRVDGASLRDDATVILSAGATLTLAGDETIGSLSEVAIPALGTVALGTHRLTLTSGTGVDAEYFGAITGSGGITVTGGTHQLIGGTSGLDNTFTGEVRVTGGSLLLRANGSTSAVVSGGTLSGTLGSGLTLTISDTGTFSNSRTQTIASLTQSGTGTLAGNQNLTITGAYNLSGGSVSNTATITAGTFTMSGGSINSGATVNSGSTKTLSGGTIAGTLGGAGATSVTGSVVVSGTLSGSATTINAGTLQIGDGGTTGSLGTGNVVNNANLTCNRSDDLTVTNVISGTGGITQAGTGTLTLSGANTYTGATTITAGTLRVTNINALGGITGNTVVSDGATLEVETGGSAPLREGTITLNGTGVGGGGALRFSGIGGNIASSISLGSNASIVSVASGTVIFSGEYRDAFGRALYNITGNNHDLTFGGTGRMIVEADIILGTGSLIKTGGGQLDLLGSTSLSGTFAVNEGRVEFVAGGNLTSTGLVTVASGAQLNLVGNNSIGNLSGAGGLELANGTLTLGDGSDQSFSGVISDSTRSEGNLTKQGSGTLTLSGANTCRGVTTINAGILRATHNAALGTTAGGTVVASGASLEFSGGITTSENITLSGTGVGGGGALRNISGNNVLSGAITLMGDTLLNNNTGSFITGGLDLNGSISGAGHTLSFSGNSRFSLNGNIATGTGGITKSGTGRVILTGTNSFTGDVVINQGDLWVRNGNAIADTVLVRVNSGGTFRIDGAETVGNVSGAGNVDIGVLGGAGHLTLGDTTDTEISGVISGGNGNLTKQGTGTLTLSGTNTYTGTTTINAGRLAVNGSITSASTVNSGGTLGGSGTVGAVTVNAGGRLAAGNSIGTLNTSSVTLNAGAILEVEVDPSDAARADLINVTGDFTINGATLRHVGEAGTYVPSRTWRIVTTTGAVSGTFGTVTSDYTFLDPTAIYGPNFVDLRLMRNDVSFESIARTRNQRETSRGISTISGSDPYNTLVTLSGDAARNALDQFSGAGLAAIGSGQLGEGQGMVDTLSGQMGGAGGGIVTASSRGTGGAAPLWANLYGTGASRDVDGITTDLRNGGVMIGHDLDFGAWQGGVMVGFGQSRTDTTTLRTTSKTDSFSLGTYAARSFGEMDVNLGLIATWGDVQSTRTLAVGALNQTLQARYSTRMLTGFGEVARRFEGAVWSATPFARITQQWLQNDSFAETGGTAALTRGAETTNQTLLSLGAEVERALGIGTLSANFALTQSFGAGAQATYRLGNSTPFTIEGDAARDTSVDLGLGYDITLPNAATLSLTAGTTRQGETNTRRIGVNLGMRF
ncbi:MAG: autotransporter domain-containing protein [Rhodobacteraceae bacterium]|nr:autotransporter domain-containing protein [Paracoccaceae bacterium]